MNTAAPSVATSMDASLFSSPSAATPPPAIRLAVDPDTMERDLVRLVLTLVEFIRRLLEAQAVRRMDAGTISDTEAEQLGMTLLRGREAIVSLCERFGCSPESLNLDLGPLGRLM